MRRTRLSLARAHRWASLTLGLLLLVVVLSGVVLVLAPEIEQVTRPSLYDTTSSGKQIPAGDAMAIVHREMPDLEMGGAYAYVNRGAWEVYAGEETVRVDEHSGEILGTLDREHGVMAFIANMHECWFTCEEMSGYVGFLNKPAQLWGLDLTINNEGTWGSFILAVSGVLLLLLVASGLYLWWPGRGKLKRGLKVRRGKGRYKLHYDLHKVVGFVALPALAIWALTGINFEMPKQSEGAYYAVTPGSAAPESLYEFESKPGSGPGVSMSEAIADARTAVPSGSTLVSVAKPEPGEPGGHYEMWFAHGVDTYAYGNYPGNYGVYVDRYSGRAEQYFPNPGNDTVTNNFMQNWAGAIHMGNLVGWIPRLAWVGFGLTPLLLAFTGIYTWLTRRRLKRRKGKGRGEGDGDSRAAPKRETVPA